MPSPPIVAPFSDDIDLLNGGTIYYRQIVDDAALFVQLQQAIQFHFPNVGDFYASLVFIATWDRVASHEIIHRDLTNTFQCLVITNGTMSFVAFNYASLEWRGSKSLVGVSAGDRKNFIVHPLSLLLDNTTVLYRVDGKIDH